MDKSFVSSNDELFYLKWNNFQKNVSTQFEKLREEDDLVDITFACEGRKLTAHKLVLFACSPFFKELLKKNPSPHPVFFMNDVKYDVLKAILEYMYLGEVHITNENLKDFIKTAEGLQIRGLSKENNTDLSMPPAPATPQTSSVSHMIPIGRKVIIDDKETIVTAENVQLLDELCRKRPVDTGTGELTGGNGQGGQVVGLNIKRIKTTVVESAQIQSSDGSEPKVEMVEYLDAETTNHQSPTYCSMDNFTEKSNSRNNLTHMGQINTATFTQTPTQPSSSGHQQQQQQQHVQHEYKSEEDSSWMDKSLDNISVNSEHQQQQQQPGQQGQQTVKYKGKSGSGGGGGGGSSRSQRSSEDKTNCLTPRCCPVCSRLYSNVSNLRQHMRLIHNPTAVCCPICQKHFNSELYLKRHYSSIHSINPGTGTGDGGELVEQKPQPAQLAAQQTSQQQQQQQQHQGQQQQQQQQQTNTQQQQQQQGQTPASTNTWNPYHHDSTQLVNPFIK